MDVRRRNRGTVTGPADAPVLVLAHGFGCDQNMWRLVVPALAERYRVVLFDYVGSGGSDLSAWSQERYSSLDGYAQDVTEVCEALDLERAVFVGHSVSAMVGVLAAQAAPERIGALVMVAPSPCYIDDEGYRGGFTAEDIDELLASLEANYLGWSSAMAPMIMGNPERPELGQELTNSFCATDPDIARVFARTTFLTDSRDDLKKVTVPTLVLECAQDVIAPVRSAPTSTPRSPPPAWSPSTPPGTAPSSAPRRSPRGRSSNSSRAGCDVPQGRRARAVRGG